MSKKPKPRTKAKTKAARLPARIAKEPGTAIIIRPDAPPAESLMLVIARAASDHKFNPDNMEKLLAMHERILANQARGEFARAFVDLQAVLPVLTQNGRIQIWAKNDPRHEREPIQSTPYAKWEDINEQIQPILAAHKFALSFRTETVGDGRLKITGVLRYGTHEDTSSFTLPLDTSGSKNNVQGAGSSLSYGQRYTAKALLNLVSRAPEDTDKDGHESKAVAGELLISQSQVEQIIALCDETGLAKEKFCETYGVDAIPRLPASRYDDAVTRLEKRRGAVAARTPPKTQSALDLGAGR